MDWTFLEQYPQYRPTELVRASVDRLHRRLLKGEPGAIANLLALLDAEPVPRGTNRREFHFTVEACVEQALVQLPPNSAVVPVILLILIKRPEHLWTRSREAFLDAVYQTHPNCALEHFPLLLELNPEGPELFARAMNGNGTAMRTLLNMQPNRAMVAGLVERALDGPREVLMEELNDSFQSLEWLDEWSPRWRLARLDPHPADDGEPPGQVDPAGG